MEKKTKHAIANTLRRVGLLQYVDKIIYLKDLLEHRRANKKFMSTHKDFALPPAHLAFDAYGHSNMESYAVSGKVTAKIIADLILSNLDSENLTIFEWGCGPGRVIRHLKTQLKNANLELFGSDYNPESINWCKDNIKGIQFSINPLHPPYFTVIIFSIVHMHYQFSPIYRRQCISNG